VDSLFPGGKDTHRGEHRTEVTKVTEEDLRFDCGRVFGGRLGFWAGKTPIGESIAQRSRRSQRRIKVRLRKIFGVQLGFWAGKRASSGCGSLALELCNPKKGATRSHVSFIWIRQFQLRRAIISLFPVNKLLSQ
jgi:hypothetical protein